MKLRGLNLLRIHGIQITLDYSWFIIFFLVAYSMAESYFPPAEKLHSTPQYWLMGITAASLFFLSVLAHELAHSLVALKQGIKVLSIRLFISAGSPRYRRNPGRAETSS